MPGGRHLRPRGQPYTFACRDCRITLTDGVEYTWCPRCGAEVDWIDGRYRVLVCASCDLLVNQREVAQPRSGEHVEAACPTCARPLTQITGPLPAESPPETGPLWTMTKRTGLALLIIQAALGLLDPEAFPYLGPLLFYLQIAALLVVAWFASNSRELHAIASYHTTRVIHGLEHATVKVLEERGVPVRGGMTSTGMFEIFVEHRGGTLYEHLESTVRDAATDAISRIRFGERALAYDPRCGTSLVVGAALLAFSIVVAGMTALVLGVPSGVTFALTVAAGFIARVIWRPVGLAAQRWFTVSTRFTSALVTHVEKRVSPDGGTLTAIVMLDVVPKARTTDVDAVAPVSM